MLCNRKRAPPKFCALDFFQPDLGQALRGAPHPTMPATPHKKGKKSDASPAKPSRATAPPPDDTVDVASSLLAEALGRSCISPAKSAAAPKATGMAPAEVAQDDDYFPLTSRRGHDLNEDNWAERSKRIAALKQKNEAAELEARLRMGMLTKKEQAKLGPTLLAEVEAAAVARENQVANLS